MLLVLLSLSQDLAIEGFFLLRDTGLRRHDDRLKKKQSVIGNLFQDLAPTIQKACSRVILK
jgi:hypothetical protein